MAPRPTEIRKQDGDHLFLAWEDGRQGSVAWKLLRDQCPCASCNEERSQPPNPFRVVKPEELAAGPPRPVRMEPMGHYAYKIIWNDGHDSGIYPLELLYRLTTKDDAPQ